MYFCVCITGRLSLLLLGTVLVALTSVKLVIMEFFLNQNHLKMVLFWGFFYSKDLTNKMYLL